jgi:hypothetical protein
MFDTGNMCVCVKTLGAADSACGSEVTNSGRYRVTDLAREINVRLSWDRSKVKS